MSTSQVIIQGQPNTTVRVESQQQSIVVPGTQGQTLPVSVIGLTDKGQNVFIGPDAPFQPPESYVWIQTGLGTGNDWTIWFEDGTP